MLINKAELVSVLKWIPKSGTFVFYVKCFLFLKYKTNNISTGSE